jgi:predicted phosphodiesterase
MKPARVLVLPDMQIYWDKGITGIDLDTWHVVLKYIRDHKWDECVIIGDFLDFNCISSHNDDKLRLVEGQRIKKDYWAGNFILDQLQDALGRKTQITLIEGNHEYRMERMIDKLPVLEGWVEVETGLRLDERGIKYIKGWAKGQVYRIGKAGFIHGLYTNDHHAKKTAARYGIPIFYGHTHDVQEYSAELKGDDKTIVGASLGCLCKYNLPYMRGRPSKWQQAIAVFYFRTDGYFNHYICRIFKHSFTSPEGKRYTP